jgi:hypothetical protein
MRSRLCLPGPPEQQLTGHAWRSFFGGLPEPLRFLGQTILEGLGLLETAALLRHRAAPCLTGTDAQSGSHQRSPREPAQVVMEIIFQLPAQKFESRIFTFAGT